MEHQYWAYIMSSLSGTLYIGFTSDLDQGVWEHKTGAFEGFSQKNTLARVWFIARNLTAYSAPSAGKSNGRVRGDQGRSH
jgi:putative endonuclease